MYNSIYKKKNDIANIVGYSQLKKNAAVLFYWLLRTFSKTQYAGFVGMRNDSTSSRIQCCLEHHFNTENIPLEHCQVPFI